MKRCSKCGARKPKAEFHRNSRKPDGLFAWCKVCACQVKRLRDAANRESINQKARAYSRGLTGEKRARRNARKRHSGMTTDEVESLRVYNRSWKAANSPLVKAAKERSRKKARAATAEKRASRGPLLTKKQIAARYAARHRAELKEKSRLYRITNPEKYKELRRLGSSRRRARVRKALVRLTPPQWRAVRDNFLGLCAYCLDRPACETIDHFRPLARDGGHVVDNVVPACERCNCRKSDRLIFDWLRLGVGVCPPSISTSNSIARSSRPSLRSVVGEPFSSASVEVPASRRSCERSAGSV